MDFTFLNIGIKQVIQKFSNLNPETGTLLVFRFDTEDVQFQLPVIGTTTLPTVLVQFKLTRVQTLRVVDVGGFEPPASWLQTKHSSN